MEHFQDAIFTDEHIPLIYSCTRSSSSSSSSSNSIQFQLSIIVGDINNNDRVNASMTSTTTTMTTTTTVSCGVTNKTCIRRNFKEAPSSAGHPIIFNASVPIYVADRRSSVAMYIQSADEHRQRGIMSVLRVAFKSIKKNPGRRWWCSWAHVHCRS